MKIAGSRAFVTGANRGLGRSLVQAFLNADAARVFAGVRNPESMSLADPRLEVIRLDVTDDASVLAAADKCAADVDVLVNNAASLFNTPLMGVADLAGARNEMETNYWGVLRMCRAFSPHFAARHDGCIVNILSIGALAGIPFCGSYCATKAACLSLTQAIGGELEPQGIKVIPVFPGPIATDMALPGQTEGRCPPEKMAASILSALERHEAMIFPDPVAEAVAAQYGAAPWSLAQGLSRQAAARRQTATNLER
jgi:NAD(P)-dependent dehydrogenase (short-subunit alcohol dehydrogenase family)